MSNIKGYKVFNSDWTCRNFQYKVGQTFEHKGNIEMCGNGFHFCRKASDCFSYYNFDSNNKVAEVEAIGLVETEENKSVTDRIAIVREVPWSELLTIVNEGKDCTGLCNTGDCNTGNRNTGDWNTGNRNTGNCNTGNRNTGDWNTGDWNTGNRNTGDWNTGNWNTGNCNTGNRNTGNWNTGDWNTGNRNTGDCNTGDWNTGNRNTGNCNTGNRNTGNCNTGDWNTGDWNIIDYSSNVFSTKEEKINIFDEPSDMTLSEWRSSKASQILRWNFESTVWIYEGSMSDEEKEQYPTYKTTGGYLKKFTFKESCKNMWEVLTDDEKETVKNIPNFSASKFKTITGMKEINANEKR